MKKHPSISIIVISTSLVLWSCGESHYKHEKMAAADTSAWAATESKAITESAISAQLPQRQFIRTAEIKGKVKNVEASTYAIEKMAQEKGGFVVASSLQRNEDRHFSTQISSDSLLSTTYSTTTNRIVLRIPHTQFDSSLYAIATLFSVLDQRNIRSNDASFQILRNKLIQERVRKHEKRLDKLVTKRPGKVDEALTGEDALYSLGEQGEEAFVENLSLEDQVQYSTVTLEIYQEQLVARTMQPNLDNLDAFEPSFSRQALQSLALSWEILEALVLFLLKFWWILGTVLGLVLWNIGRRKEKVLS